ncbi:MAG: ABC transporter substrate-binding protein, partial [Planctomycetota bacterium]
AVLKVRTLDFPGRVVPDPFPKGKLEVRLVDKPTEVLEVQWSSIRRIELFEQILLAEGVKLTRAKKYDQAFDFFQRLHRTHPSTPGLPEATSTYLQGNAKVAFEAGQFDRALAILASLYERQPNAEGLAGAVDAVAGKIIQGHLDAGGLRTARTVLDVVEKRFAELSLSVTGERRGRFQQQADERVADGARAFRAKQYRRARAAANQALSIWPSHKRAAQLLGLVQRAQPTVVVGVRTAATLPLRQRVDSPASIRAGFLAAQTLTRITDYSPEGGVYASPVGIVGLDATGRELSLTVLDYPRDSAAAYAAPARVARWLLKAATPQERAYRPAIARVLGGVLTPEPDLLVVELARTHVRPEALLSDVGLDECGLPAPFGAFGARRPEGEENQSLLALEARSQASAITNIDEVAIQADDDAIAKLLSGEVDLLDRVAPWQLPTLRSDDRIQIGRYRLPTVHVLIPHNAAEKAAGAAAQRLLDSREFRRALCYGLDRERILDELILAGARMPEYQVVSGPFPAGMSLSDGVRYGYNDAVKPRPYEPRLAALLANVGWSNTVAAERQDKRQDEGKSAEAEGGDAEEAAEEPLPPLPKLRLAHDSDPIARTACQAIQMQLAPLGIKIELIELPAAELLAGGGGYDLRYAELATWEPAVDAKRVLGPDGVAGRCSDPMFEALKQLDEARNWREAVASLADIHELAAGDLPVIPLWQTANFYAARREVSGLPPSTIHLYQSIADWRKSATAP